MTTLETLKAARKLIELPEHWTRGTFARDVKGNSIPWDQVSTCPIEGSFCALGALWRARGSDYTREDEAALRAVLQEKFRGIDNFNDTHAHAEVLAAFDEAIARLEAL